MRLRVSEADERSRVRISLREVGEHAVLSDGLPSWMECQMSSPAYLHASVHPPDCN